MHGIDWSQPGHSVAESWIIVIAVLLLAALLTWILRRVWMIRRKGL